jgi:hypothetical protein
MSNAPDLFQHEFGGWITSLAPALPGLALGAMIGLLFFAALFIIGGEE